MIYIWIFLFVLELIILYYLYRRRENPESSLYLKLIGYFLLGGFTFSMNGFKLPLGFLIFLVFFKPKWNPKIKRDAAILGLVVFALQIAVPAVENYAFERPRQIPVSGMQLEKVDFPGQWNQVASKLNVSPDARMARFEAVYGTKGEIHKLNYEVVERDYDHEGIWLSSCGSVHIESSCIQQADYLFDAVLHKPEESVSE